MAKRQYTSEEKALAVSIVERHGGKVTKQAMQTIQDVLVAPNLNRATVTRWVQAAPSQPVATELQPIKKKAAELANQKLDDVFEDLARKLLEHALKDNIIGEMKGREAVTAAAIAVDKMRLLRDMPTEIVQLWPGFMDALNELGLAPARVFESLIEQAAAEKARRNGGSDTRLD
jgi:transposase